MLTITEFVQDENGFIVSAELVLVASVLVLGMLVGMSQVQNAVVSELNDVAHAIGSFNQSYYYSGFSAWKWGGWIKSRTYGSAFYDLADACDGWGCMISCDGAVAEGGWCGGYAGCSGGVGYGSTGGWATGSSCSSCSSCSACGTSCAP